MVDSGWNLQSSKFTPTTLRDALPVVCCDWPFGWFFSFGWQCFASQCYFYANWRPRFAFWQVKLNLRLMHYLKSWFVILTDSPSYMPNLNKYLINEGTTSVFFLLWFFNFQKHTNKIVKSHTQTFKRICSYAYLVICMCFYFF